jgi:hypothetical protein
MLKSDVTPLADEFLLFIEHQLSLMEGTLNFVAILV